jgi:hypothetical protein
LAVICTDNISTIRYEKIGGQNQKKDQEGCLGNKKKAQIFKSISPKKDSGEVKKDVVRYIN